MLRIPCIILIAVCAISAVISRNCENDIFWFFAAIAAFTAAAFFLFIDWCTWEEA